MEKKEFSDYLITRALFSAIMEKKEFCERVPSSASGKEKELSEYMVTREWVQALEPLELVKTFPQGVVKYPNVCFTHQNIKYLTKYNHDMKPPADFMFGMSLILAHMPPIYPGGYVWLYRGMSKAEAAQIANGLYRDVSFYWTPIRHKAAGYGQMVCAIHTPAVHIRGEYKPFSEVYIIPFAALDEATEIRFYRPFGSMFLNKCCNLLIFRRLSEKIFGKYRPKLYLRLAKRKVMKYEI